MKVKLLYIDSCVSLDYPSRTRRLGEAFAAKCRAAGFEIDRLTLENEQLEPMSGNEIRKRTALLREGKLDDASLAHARSFSQADLIAVAAPYWDLSFPAMLKVYIEHIMVSGITFKYTAEGPVGLCRARELVYITTSGGFIGDNDFGYDYLRGICRMVGISKTREYRAEGLDIDGFDADGAAAKAIARIERDTL